MSPWTEPVPPVPGELLELTEQPVELSAGQLLE
jgi:hypothetical protein